MEIWDWWEIEQAVVFAEVKDTLSRIVVFNWGWFCPPGDIWLCLEAFLVATPRNEGITGI